MKSQADYVELLVSLLQDNPLSLSEKNLRRDIETVRSRYSAEGLSFLTKTLPKLGKALDVGLADTKFVIPEGFASLRNESTPCFMQAYFKMVFTKEGDLLADADPEAVKHLRQVLLFAYKLKLPYSRESEESVIDGFISTEKELELGADGYDSSVIAAASYIIRRVFDGFDPKNIVCRHGPGAVATGERLDAKWEFSRLYSNIHQVYPYYDYFVVGGPRELLDRLAWYKSLDRQQSGSAKVVLVPKDSRGPRLISCEPLEYQWVQQGLGRAIVGHLEKGSLTRGQINFTDQSINRDLAYESSKTLFNATIDMKDASDRVSLRLVRALFRHNQPLLEALLAVRTSSTVLPDGRVVELNKYAPMGSAVCFPVEAVCFWAIIVASIARSTRRPIEEVGRSVFVYGDDIVIPTTEVDTAIAALESVHLRVNRSKCCIHGPFRESCGMDAFKGVEVTPIRLRTLWTGASSDGAAYVAYVELYNALEKAGYTRTACLVRAWLETTYGKLPYGTSHSSYPCILVEDAEQALISNARADFECRYNEPLQRLEWRLLSTKVRREETTLDDWPRLLRDTTMGAGDDPTHIVFPRSMKLKRGWTPVF